LLLGLDRACSASLFFLNPARGDLPPAWFLLRQIRRLWLFRALGHLLASFQVAPRRAEKTATVRATIAMAME
jgi:hypothetical protein